MRLPAKALEEADDLHTGRVPAGQADRAILSADVFQRGSSANMRGTGGYAGSAGPKEPTSTSSCPAGSPGFATTVKVEVWSKVVIVDEGLIGSTCE